jgi:hypothetical protein
MEAIAYCTTFLPEHIPSYEDTERSFSFLNRKTISTNFAKSRDALQASGKRGSCDVWIGAGGGFQALGALHVFPEQLDISLSSLITGEDSGH